MSPSPIAARGVNSGGAGYGCSWRRAALSGPPRPDQRVDGHPLALGGLHMPPHLLRALDGEPVQGGGYGCGCPEDVGILRAAVTPVEVVTIVPDGQQRPVRRERGRRGPDQRASSSAGSWM